MECRTVCVALLLGSTAFACTGQVPSANGGMVYQNPNQIDPKAITLKAVKGIAHDEDGVVISKVSLGLFTEKDHKLVMSSESATDGTFEFDGVAPGLYRLVARYDGFCPANVPISLVHHAAANRSVDLHMKLSGIDTCSYGVQGARHASKIGHASH